MRVRRKTQRLGYLALLCLLAVLLVCTVARWWASSAEHADSRQTDELAAEVEQASATAFDEVDELSGHSVSRSTTSEQVAGELVDVATAEIEVYEEQVGVVLARAGYLDLTGDVWSCTVLGPGWVDTCVVSEDEDSGGCTVVRVRMAPDEG